MLIAALIVASAALLVSLVAGTYALVVLSRNRGPQTAPERPASSFLEELSARVAGLELVVQGLPSLWEEERERSLKHANRAYQSEKRVTELLAASEAGEWDDDEDEADNVLALDAIRSEREPVHPMSDSMGLAPDADLQARADAVIARGF